MTKSKHTVSYLRAAILAAELGLLSFSIILAPVAAARAPQSVNASWTTTGNMNNGRYGHTATFLRNGKVLVAGGAGPNSCSTTTSTAELYDPVTGTWSATGNLNTARISHTATLLQSGQVLVAGGAGGNGHKVSLDSAELYDPATGMWRTTGNFSTIRGRASATLLPNGKVLAVGGSGAGPTAELYDPITGTWSNTGAPDMGGYQVLLPNGKVLAVWEGSPWDNYYGGLLAELYDPATGHWSDTGFVHGMLSADTLTLLRNGEVLIIGDGGKSQLYDTTTETWSLTGSFNTSRYNFFTATLQADGRVLVAGGNDNNGFVSQAELYDPTVGTWGFTSHLNVPRISHTGTLLANGKTLIVGGWAGLSNTCNDFIVQSAEVYDPGISSITNPIDDSQSFVRQHYLDFLNREPDQGGWDYWTSQITGCGGDPLCVHQRRIDVSAAFFIEHEFQQTGYVVYRLHRAAVGVTRSCSGSEEVQCSDTCTAPCFPQTRAKLVHAQFVTDRAQLVGGPGLPQNTIDFANAFVQRPEFKELYPDSMSPPDFVNTLFDTADLTGAANFPHREAAIAALTNGSKTRAQVLLDIIEIDELKIREYNPAFVLMQYFGYLQRDPEEGGYFFWLDVLNNRVPGNFRGMVCAFLTSAEYQRRFGSVVSRTDQDCAQ